MKRIVVWRGFNVTKRELVADALFFGIAAALSIIGIIIFNIHWSFYPGNTLFPPSKTVGIEPKMYVAGTLIGAIVGFFIIKLFLLGVRVEESTWFAKTAKR